MPNKPHHPLRTPSRATSASSADLAASDAQSAAAQAIASTGRTMERILGDRALLCVLASRGFDITRIQQGLALHTAAEQSFATAESIFVAVEEAASTRAFTFAAARNDYADFRRAIKAACNHDGHDDPLDASQYPRQSVRRFVAQATASYLAAFKTVPLDLIAEQNFDLHRLNRALARVRRLLILDTGCHARARQAHRAAVNRDVALRRLNTWVAEFFVAIQLALVPHLPPSSTRRRAHLRPFPRIAPAGDATHPPFPPTRPLRPNSPP